jgi:hypothetical protein
LIIADLSPDLLEPLATELEMLPECLFVTALIERFSRPMVESSANEITELIANDLLVVQCDTLSVFWLVLRQHPFAEREEQGSATDNGLIAGTYLWEDVSDELASFNACLKFHGAYLTSCTLTKKWKAIFTTLDRSSRY